MLDLSDLECEAEQLAEKLRGARCCDALVPCYRCSLLKYNVLARRRVVEVPRPAPDHVRPPGTGQLVLADSAADLERHAS
ncbi:MAG TPA: hypothetical protein VF165_08240 [Nocardioidaceae bacterium]